MKKCVYTGLILLVGLCGCADPPTRQQLISKEKHCLESYCSRDVASAEIDLIDCIRYAQRCRKSGIPGIDYDQTLARLNARLYLVERHLGHEKRASRCLLGLQAASQSQNRPLVPGGNLDEIVELRFDKGLEVAWRHHSKQGP